MRDNISLLIYDGDSNFFKDSIVKIVLSEEVTDADIIGNYKHRIFKNMKIVVYLVRDSSIMVEVLDTTKPNNQRLNRNQRLSRKEIIN